MLLQNKIKSGDVVSMKLTTGEEVLARFKEDTDTDIIVSKPLCVVVGQGIGLAPYAFTMPEDGNFPINKDHIITMVIADKKVTSEYIQHTTGLSVVKTT